MSFGQAILLALIQGITEFLPISSSAHLVLTPYLLGWRDHPLLFDVVVNAGTLTAAMLYFRHDVGQIGRQAYDAFVTDLGRLRHGRRGRARFGLGPAVVLASLPVLVLGYSYYGWFATAARDPVLIAVASIVFGLLLWAADRTAPRLRDLDDLTWRDSLWIGLAQAIALVPGTSRSGITLTAGLFLGFERTEAARFSFLMAIPVGILAFVFDLGRLALGGTSAVQVGPLVAGFVVSALTAYLVIGWLLAFLKRQGLTVFVVYRILLGLGILALTLRQTNDFF